MPGLDNGEGGEDVQQDLPEVEDLVVVAAQVPAELDEVAEDEDGHHGQQQPPVSPAEPDGGQGDERADDAQVQPPPPDEVFVGGKLVEAEAAIVTGLLRGGADKVAGVLRDAAIIV